MSATTENTTAYAGDHQYVPAAFASDSVSSTSPTTGLGYTATPTELAAAQAPVTPGKLTPQVVPAEYFVVPNVSETPAVSAGTNTVVAAVPVETTVSTAAPAEGPASTTYMDSIRSGVATAAGAAAGAAAAVTETVKNTVIPKATELASTAASTTYNAAQTASNKVAESGAIPRAQQAASNTASSAASAISAGATRAKDLVAGAVAPSTTESSLPDQPFTLASDAPVEAHYGGVPAGGASVPLTSAFSAYPVTRDLAYGSAPVDYVGPVPGKAAVPDQVVSGQAPSVLDTTYTTSTPTIYGTPAAATLDTSYATMNTAPVVEGQPLAIESATITTQPTVAGRAGDVAGSVAGSVGGALSTAASMAKNAVVGSAPSTTTTETVQPAQPASQTTADVLTRAGSVAGSVAGTVAGTLATVASAAKNAAVSAVSAVKPSSTVTETALVPTGEMAVVPATEPAFNVNDITPLPYDEGNLIDINAERELSNTTTTPATKSALQSTAEGAAAAAGYTAGAAAKVRDTVVNAASSAYNAAAGTASSAYNSAANTAASARDTVTSTATGAYNSVADTAAQYTAGSSLKPTTATSYHLTESDIPQPLVDVRPDAPAGLDSSLDGTQRALPPAPIKSAEDKSAGVMYGAGFLPSAGGLLNDDAIKAVATPADQRTQNEQKLVDKLLEGKELTADASASKPPVTTTTNYGSAEPVAQPTTSKTESALPADIPASQLNDEPSDDASTRSIPPASIPDDEPYQSDGSFGGSSRKTASSTSASASEGIPTAAKVAYAPVSGAVAPAIPAANNAPLSGYNPSESSASSANNNNTNTNTNTTRDISSSLSSHTSHDNTNIKASKSHGILDKAIGKVTTGVGRVLGKDSMVEHGKERYEVGKKEIEIAKKH